MDLGCSIVEAGPAREGIFQGDNWRTGVGVVSSSTRGARRYKRWSSGIYSYTLEFCVVRISFAFLDGIDDCCTNIEYESVRLKVPGCSCSILQTLALWSVKGR